MEMSRMLLICAMVVACVYAGQKKGMSVKNNDLCDKYTDTSDYASCGVQDDNGNELCYLNTKDHVKCDSVKDCPNFADEKGCKKEHMEYCASGFEGKDLEVYHCANFTTADGFPEGDSMCISTLQLCDGESDCPQRDDEANCPNNK
ncbi:LDL receptor repeat-containing protein egg-1-like [Asterias rubens]|uniref:LDL receptor repeat-containing protein egg-1-like n=1 Tax=Asterias rubens TaxID=7604 RepID=UPI00145595AF|nr:LDL receptor repeat-containing protein egg-1-like [Asterias rubens]